MILQGSWFESSGGERFLHIDEYEVLISAQEIVQLYCRHGRFGWRKPPFFRPKPESYQDKKNCLKLTRIVNVELYSRKCFLIKPTRTIWAELEKWGALGEKLPFRGKNSTGTGTGTGQLGVFLLILKSDVGTAECKCDFIQIRERKESLFERLWREMAPDTFFFLPSVRHVIFVCSSKQHVWFPAQPPTPGPTSSTNLA